MQDSGHKSIRPHELKQKLDAGEDLLLLDVRQPWEFELSKIEGSRLAPPEELANVVSRLDRAKETVVICHHGVRSAHVARLMQEAGFERVFNLEGGLDAYSDVDDSVPRY